MGVKFPGSWVEGWCIGQDGQPLNYSAALRPQPNLFYFQYCTGRHDYNGKEIYEGDIIKYSRVITQEDGDEKIYFEDIGQIYYDSQKISFALKGEKKGEYTWVHHFYNGKWTDGSVARYEVIGNIFENPNLLK